MAKMVVRKAEAMTVVQTMAATRKLGSTGVALCAVAAMLLVPSLAGAAWAQGPPESGTGTGTIIGLEVLDSRDAGPNRIETRELTVMLDGALQGTFVQVVTGVVGADDRVHFQGTGEFTGVLIGCGEGTVHFRLNGRGQAGMTPGLPATTAKAAVIDQAANTLPATGRATLEQEGFALTYEVQYVCHAG